MRILAGAKTLEIITRLKAMKLPITLDWIRRWQQRDDEIDFWYFGERQKRVYIYVDVI